LATFRANEKKNGTLILPAQKKKEKEKEEGCECAMSKGR
jgi:hypothetical protein